MAVAFRAKTATTGHSAGSITATEPAGTVQNDIMLMLVVYQRTTGTHGPTGWTTLTSATAGSSFFSALFAIRRGAAAPAFAVDDNGNNLYVEISVSSWSGVDTGVALASLVVTSATPTTSSPSNPDPPSITTTVANSINVCVGVSWGGVTAGGYTAPSGYTIGENGLTLGVGSANTFAYKTIVSPGAEDPGAFSGAATGSQPWWAACVELPPPAAAATFAARSFSRRQAVNRASTY